MVVFNRLKTLGKGNEAFQILSLFKAFKWQFGNSVISKVDSHLMESSLLSISERMLFQNHHSCSSCFSQSWLAKLWVIEPFHLCMLKGIPFPLSTKSIRVNTSASLGSCRIAASRYRIVTGRSPSFIFFSPSSKAPGQSLKGFSVWK